MPVSKCDRYIQSGEFVHKTESNRQVPTHSNPWFVWYGKGYTKISMPFSGSQAIFIPEEGEYELETTDFDDIDLGTIEIVDFELTPYREDDDPYYDTCPDCGNPIGIHNDGGNGFCTSCAPWH